MFFKAIYYNDVNAIRKLLKAGANPAAHAENGMNALHIAVAHGNMRIAKTLIRAGAPLHPKGRGAYEALIAACSHGYLESVKFLLGAGVKPNHPIGKLRRTPLHIAAFETETEHIKIFDLLLKAGADLNALDQEGKTPWQVLCEWAVYASPRALNVFEEKICVLLMARR